MLEPGCGTGLFIATRPAKLDGCIAFTGIEMDAVTARIARRLYPRQWIRQGDLTKAKLDSGYDLAIGNPPFSNRSVHNADDRALWGFSLHDYFIARSIEALRPGGIAAFVTPRHTLDKSSTTARAHMQGIRKGEQKEGLFQKHARIIEALIPVRDAARRVLRAQMENQPFAKGQGDLKRAYQAFVRQFGPINLTKTRCG